MIDKLLSAEVQSFLKDHRTVDPHEILFKYGSVHGLPSSVIVDQLVGRRKAEERLPTWHREEKIIYPPSLNVEQASSEQAALVKVDLLRNKLGDTSSMTLVDLTGGFGVDSYFFSKAFANVNFVEPIAELIEIARHNHRILGASNIHYHNCVAENFLESPPETSFDVIFIDPSRRITGNKKVFSLSESVPDVVELQRTIFGLSANVLIKTSPLLDIQVGLKELDYVKDVFITSINNDCKEVLFFCQRNFESEPTITAINLNGRDAEFSFRISEERSAENRYSDPLQFVYEPNASLLKGGAFKILGVAFDLAKLHPNTHLFTSSTFNDHFPGRVFQIESIVKPNEKLAGYFLNGRANIFTRNYPLAVNELRKKYRLKDGGERYVIGCSGMNKKFLLLARRVR